MKPRRIEMRIDELLLEGVDPRDRGRVLASLERELARRMARGELPHASQAAIVGERSNDSNPADLGAHVARVIAKGGER